MLRVMVLMLVATGCDKSESPQPPADAAPEPKAVEAKEDNAEQKADSADAKEAEAEAKVDAEGDLLDTEHLGKLRLGQSAAELEKTLGPPAKKGKKQFQEATGDTIQEWDYPKKGLSLWMVDDADGTQSINAITVAKGCAFKTARGIGIGSTREAVEQAYGNVEAEFGSDERSFVAGSLYGGVIFEFDDAGKVVSIFFGAAAE